MRAHTFSYSLWAIVGGLLVSFLTASPASAEGLLDEIYGGGRDSSCACEPEEEACSYGPCCCEPRGTLMQWSYGTSFSGGADLDEPLVSDRPDFTESTVTVGRGVSQIEIGYTYSFDEEFGDTTRTNSYPQFLLRQGMLAEWFELRIFWSQSDERTTTGGVPGGQSGADDMSIGFKIALTPQECLLPEMAMILQTTVPTGSGPGTTDDMLPGVIWIYSWEINDWLSFAGSTAANRAIDDAGATYTELAQSLVFGFGLTDHVGAYLEWYAFFPSGAVVATPEHTLNGGFTYLINNDLQLDISAGVGLNRAADDYFVGTGIVWRFY